jgi:hypothetical protein
MRKRVLIATGLLLVGLVVTLGAALAQNSPNYNLEWYVVGGGGQPLSSANYVVNGTAGQGVASPPYCSSGQYVVGGGYWSSEGLTVVCYLPLGLKNYP